MTFDRDKALATARPQAVGTRLLVGVLPGEGVGPDVVGAALRVLAALEEAGGPAFDLRKGGPIGVEAEARYGKPLPDEVVSFCADVFAAGGAVLAGAGGGRFVYDLRDRFDLFYKLSPLRVYEELVGTTRFLPNHVRGVDILVVRENACGFYHGAWRLSEDDAGRRAEHRFDVMEAGVRRLLSVACEHATRRRGHVAVVVKAGGVPAVSQLWRDCARALADETGVAYSILEVDHAAYYLVQQPHDLDVVAAPDLYGDILADLGGALLGSRGLTYSGNFSADGAAVYQTNHGGAYDLAGADQANPSGQILSLAMMLRESFGLAREAELVEEALRASWRAGWRTFDIAEPGSNVVGTCEFADRVADAVRALAHV
jgi:3-isopropylmalate dehydrogenase